MKSNVKKYIGEGLLIVFSVLFALFINKLFDDYRTSQKKMIAKESIIKELYANQSILANWRSKHAELNNRIISVVNGQEDSLKTELKKYDYFNLGVLTNNGTLINETLTNTAWESAKAMGIITEFDFETIQKLTLVYDLQKIIVNKTTMGIFDYLFDSEANNMKNLDKTLVQLRLRFQELTGQEETMSTLYKEAIFELEN